MLAPPSTHATTLPGNPVLRDFIETNRASIIARTRDKVRSRPSPRPTEAEIEHGVPRFIDQLAARLLPGGDPGQGQMEATATAHGAELLRGGFTIGQVVHDYGDVCQAITELAVELRAPIATEDFRTLNLCLDIAIAEAVTEYSRQREETITGEGVQQLGFLAHEMRNFLNTATLAFEVVRSGSVGLSGNTSAVLERSLEGMRDLVTRSLAEVRLEAGDPRRDRILVASILEEAEIAATYQAKARDVKVALELPTDDLAVEGDAQIIASIMTNLVQNALKFTRSGGEVTIRSRLHGARVLLDVADECGGLPPGKAEGLFRPYEQRGADRSGVGLGLAISLKGARAMGGGLTVEDMPGKGCTFTLDLPRSVRAAAAPGA